MPTHHLSHHEGVTRQGDRGESPPLIGDTAMHPEQDAPLSVPRHYVRPGRVHRSVTRLVTIDTETKRNTHAGFWVHHLRCWVARLDIRDPDYAPISTATYAYGTEADALADQIDAWTRTAHTTWVYAHNLVGEQIGRAHV